MRQRQRGVALIELALILPLLLVLSFITTEFGRALYQYSVLTKSVRDAARYLTAQTAETHRVEARNLVIYGDTVNTGAPLVRGLTAANIPDANMHWNTQASIPPINTVTVSITGYCFRPLFNSAFGVNFGTVACGGALGIPYGEIAATMRAPS